MTWRGCPGRVLEVKGLLHLQNWSATKDKPRGAIHRRVLLVPRGSSNPSLYKNGAISVLSLRNLDNMINLTRKMYPTQLQLVL